MRGLGDGRVLGERGKTTAERWKRRDNSGKEDTFLWNIRLLPRGQTDPCDWLKPSRVLGISEQVEESGRGGGGGEGEKERRCQEEKA